MNQAIVSVDREDISPITDSLVDKEQLEANSQNVAAGA
jgi:hypothetical protein